MYFKKIKIYHTIRLHIILLFFLNSSYEYAGFQFLQNDRYAQKLYILIFSFYSYTKSRINVCVYVSILCTQRKQ